MDLSPNSSRAAVASRESIPSPTLSRKSSLEDFVGDMTQQNDFTPQDLSAQTIQSWWRDECVRLVSLRSALRLPLPTTASGHAHTSVAGKISETLAALSASDFEHSWGLLQGKTFIQAYSKLLQSLPRDRQLPRDAHMKMKNARYMSAALMTAHHPRQLLSIDLTLPLSWDTKRLVNSSKFYAHSLQQLCLRSLPPNGPQAKTQSFRAAFSSLRFSTRYFVLAMESWKAADTLRTVQELESMYGKACAALIIHTNNAGDAQMTQALVLELGKIKSAIFHLLKDDSTRVRVTAELEEIEANARAFAESQSVSKASSANAPVPTPSPSPVVSTTGAPVPETAPERVRERLSARASEASISEEHEKILSRLNSMLSMPNEKIIADIYFGEKLRLPDPPMSRVVWGDNEPALSEQQVQPLHERMVRLLADRIVASLCTPVLQTVEQVAVGDLVQVRADSEPLRRNKSVSHNAKITAVHSDGSVDVLFTVDEMTELRVPAWRLRVAGDAPYFPLLLQLISECMHNVAAFTPSRADLEASLAAAVDLETLARICEDGVLRPRHLVDVFIALINRMQDLQAPARIPRTQRWAEEFLGKCQECSSFNEMVPLLPKFFEFMQALMEECRIDMASFYVRSLEPVVQRVGPAYLRHKFLQHLAAGEVKLDKTYNLIRQQITALDSLQVALTAVNLPTLTLEAVIDGREEPLRLLLAGAFVQLLQSNMRLDSPQAAAEVLPETLALHAGRLAWLRDFVDRICIVCACNVVCKQFLMAKGGSRVPVESHEQAFCTRLDVLLRQPDVFLPEVALETVRYVKKCLGDDSSPRGQPHAQGTAILSREEEERIQAAVNGAMTPTHPVLALFAKRCYLLLLRACMHAPVAPFLRPFSLTQLAEPVQEMCAAAIALFDFNIQVHGLLYKELVTAHGTVGSANP